MTKVNIQSIAWRTKDGMECHILERPLSILAARLEFQRLTEGKEVFNYKMYDHTTPCTNHFKNFNGGRFYN